MTSINISITISIISVCVAVFSMIAAWISSNASMKSAKAAEKSVKTAEDQLNESKIEFQDLNRPFVEVEYFQEGLYFGIRLINHGNHTAENVRLSFDKDFIDCIQKNVFKNILKEYDEKSFLIGVGQHYDIFIGEISEDKRNPNLLPCKFTIHYEWRKGIIKNKDNQIMKPEIVSYENDYEIDIQNYVTIYYRLSNDLEKKKVEELKDIKKEVEDINSNIKVLNKIVNKIK